MRSAGFRGLGLGAVAHIQRWRAESLTLYIIWWTAVRDIFSNTFLVLVLVLLLLIVVVLLLLIIIKS